MLSDLGCSPCKVMESVLTHSEDQTREFVRLISRHSREIYAFILSVVPNWADADDILQETTVKLWNGFDRFEPGTNFVAWGCKVAYFQIKTFRQKMGRERFHFSTEFLDHIAETFDASISSIDQRRDALSHCLEQLPDKNRNLLKHVYGGGNTIRAVAKMLDKSEHAIYKALSRLRLRLYECVQRALKEDVV